MSFKLPPQIENESGEVRKVGFEIEFTGIELPRVVEIVVNLFGGNVESENRFLYTVKNAKYGVFKIEMDSTVLKDRAYKSFLDKFGIKIDDFSYKDNVEELINRIASTVVPYEIVLPPIPLTELKIIEDLRKTLYQQNALGTKASMFYAFGLHINIEIPSDETQSLLRHIQSFLLLYNWIFEDSKIDFVRRITPFINEFPDEYIRLVFSPSYKPDINQLVDDYLKFNPTRNRALDMLPIFSWIEFNKVKAAIKEDNLLKPRPAFHYRLPNCRIDDESWSIASEWNYWCEVEKLASKPEKIFRMRHAYLDLMDDSFKMFKERWHDQVRQWLSEN